MIRARSPRGSHGGVDRITDPARLGAHLDDAAHVPGGHAVALVVPRDESEVAEVLTREPRVLAIGAQSSLTGGATPRGDTLLSTARLGSMRDLLDGRLRAGAGVTLAEIDARLRGRSALYPPLPTWHGATIGGAIATNAAGASTFKYGTTRQWIDAVTVVLPSGHVLDLARGGTRAHADGYFEIALEDRLVRVPVPRYRMPDVPKLSAGYYAAPGMDLIDLFIGAEGTLGVIVEATLRVQRERPDVCLAFATFRRRDRALQFVSALRTEAMATWQAANAGSPTPGLDVSAIEHMDARSLSLLREDGVDRRLGIAVDPDAAMGLLVAIDVPAASRSAGGRMNGSAATLPEDARDTALARFDALLEGHGVTDALVALPADVAATERLLALREAVPLAVNQRVRMAQRDVDPRIEKTAADVIVPFDRFEEMLDIYGDELRRRGLDGAIWGHISDGNVHPNVIPRSFADVESGREAVLLFGQAAVRLGGSPLAEHGVGRNRTKQALLRELYGKEGIAQMRAVKAALDPEGRLARGVLLPDP